MTTQQYTYLILIDSVTTIVVGGEKMPDRKGYYLGQTATKEFDDDYAAWLKAASKYPIASKEDEAKLIELASDIIDSPTDNINLNQGILIPNERVKLYPKCKNESCDGMICGGCKQGVMCAFFSPIPEVVEKETRAEIKFAEWIFSECEIPPHKHCGFWHKETQEYYTMIELFNLFTLTRIKPNTK